jgi:hypothetical protein
MKRYLKYLILIIGLFLIFPTSSTLSNGGGIFINNEGEWEEVGDSWLTNQIVGFLKNFAYGILNFSFSLLKTVISEDFVGEKFTQNTLVDEGWDIMRDFGNIIIVVALIVIALATILDIKEYQAQKTIPILILVALLVNFSPVICGVVIDASNIIMLNFLKAGFPEQMKTEHLEEGLSNIGVEQVVGQEGPGVGQALLFAFFSIIASFVILVYALIFLLRYIALWLLVIFSPLAFVFYILKFTKKYFDQWMNQFLQWAFIGVPMSIILYLTVKMLEISDKIMIQGDSTGIYRIMASGVAPVVFLIAGLFASLQTGAVGASAVTNFAAQKARQTGRWAWKKTGGAALDQAEKARLAAGKGVKTGAKYLAREGATTVGTVARTGFLSEGFSPEAREETRQATGRLMERMHVRPVGSTEEQSRKRLKIEERQKRMEHLNNDRLNEVAHSRTSHIGDRLAALGRLAERSSLGGGDNEERLQNTMEQMRERNAFNAWGVDPRQLYHARPDLAGNRREIEEAVTRRTPGQFRREVQPQPLQRLDIVLAMDGSKMREMMVHGSREQTETIHNTIENNMEHIIGVYDDYANRNDRESQMIANRIRELIDTEANLNRVLRGARFENEENET